MGRYGNQSVEIPTLRELCLDQVRSPVRTVFDCLLVLALCAAYFPQFRTALHTSPPRIARSYIFLTFLFLTLLSASYMNIFFDQHKDCFGLRYEGALIGSENVRALMGVVQVGMLWVCEVITCLLYTYASRPSAHQLRTPTIEATDSEVANGGQSRGVSTEITSSASTPLLRPLPSSTHTITPTCPPSSSFRLNTILTSFILLLSTALFASVLSIATTPEGTPDWCGDFKCRSTILFILYYLFSVLVFVVLLVTTVRRLWKGGDVRLGNGTLVMDGKALIAQALVLMAIVGSLGQMARKQWEPMRGGNRGEMWVVVVVGALAVLRWVAGVGLWIKGEGGRRL